MSGYSIPWIVTVALLVHDFLKDEFVGRRFYPQFAAVWLVEPGVFPKVLLPLSPRRFGIATVIPVEGSQG